MKRIQEHLSRNIKKRRGLRGYTQAQLAEKVNCACNYISLIEQGKKFPSPAMLEKIAAALGVESYELFHGPEDGSLVLDDVRDTLIEEIEASIYEVFSRYV